MPKSIKVNKWNKYWKLTILEEIFTKCRRAFKCECECWNIVDVMLCHLSSWHTISCWCYRKIWITENKTTHWMTNSRIYRIWQAINNRCYNNNIKDYKYYWWRWIMCEWNSFEEFYTDMKEWYNNELSIDRIDTNKNYCRNNCRWATDIEQANNRRNNYLIEYNWVTNTLAEWSNKIWINRGIIRYNIEQWKSMWEVLKIFNITIKENE